MATKKTKVTMILSVGDLAAGTTASLDPALADEYIVKGYAEGDLSREFSDAERGALRGQSQTVGL